MENIIEFLLNTISIIFMISVVYLEIIFVVTLILAGIKLLKTFYNEG